MQAGRAETGQCWSLSTTGHRHGSAQYSGAVAQAWLQAASEGKTKREDIPGMEVCLLSGRCLPALADICCILFVWQPACVGSDGAGGPADGPGGAQPGAAGRHHQVLRSMRRISPYHCFILSGVLSWQTSLPRRRLARVPYRCGGGAGYTPGTRPPALPRSSPSPPTAPPTPRSLSMWAGPDTR